MSFNDEGQAMVDAEFRVFTAREIAAVKPMREVVRGLFPQKGLAVIYGPPEVGKSFLALDMACAIAEGAEWFGRKTIKSPVMILALEGEAGFSKRVRAWEAKNGRNIPTNVSFITGERNNGDKAGFSLTDAADVSHLHVSCKKAKCYGGVVLVDTMNRASPGMDENASQDMGKIVKGMGLLQSLLDCLVIAVHHPGKDVTRGMRGHSSLLGALDSSMIVGSTVEGDSITYFWVNGKTKDIGKSAPEGFIREVIDLGSDEYGDPITSCVVSPTYAEVRVDEKHLGPVGKIQRLIFAIAEGLVIESGDCFAEVKSNGAPSITVDALVDSVINASQKKPRRDSVQRSVSKMVQRQIFGGTYERVWFKV